MTDYYNLTALENAKSIGDYLSAAGTVSNGMLYYVLLLAVALILYMSLSRENPPHDALIATGFIIALIAALLWAGGFIAFWLIGPPLVLVLLGVGIKAYG